MNDIAAPRLERLCGTPAEWMEIAPSAPGLERMEAHFRDHAFAPHRHDTYAIGVTLHGVQSFRYRGATRASLPGQAFVLHPDELHDGHAGTGDGFGYRILYVDPALVQNALGGAPRPLPFLRDAVSADGRLCAAVTAALDDFEAPLEELRRDQIVQELADALAALDPATARKPLSALHRRAVEIARERLDADIAGPLLSNELEAATGVSRYALARHFRACLGTTPYRYLVMRRLDRARALIRAGLPLAEAATASGFADQSHMTRHFRKAYGLSPGRWSAITAA